MSSDRPSFLRRAWGSISPFFEVLREYGDLVAAGLVVVWAVFKDGQGELEGDTLTRTTAVLLAIFGWTFLRERWTRKKGFEEFKDELDKISGHAEGVARKAEDIESKADASRKAALETQDVVSHTLDVLAGEKPFQALSTLFAWEILTSDGKKARAKTVRDLRFTANNVYSIYEFSKASGKTKPGSCIGTRPGQQPVALPFMHEGFPGPQNKQFRVISLEAFLNRGDRMTIESLRDVDGSFSKSRENVEVEVTSVVDQMTIEIVWPPGYEVLTLEEQRTGSREASRPIALSVLEDLGDGRRKLLHSVENPVLNDKVFIIWTWQSSAVAAAPKATASASPSRTRRKESTMYPRTSRDGPE
jgi:hypothetical protein